MGKRRGIALFRREILSRSAEKLRGVPAFNDIEILGYRKKFIHNRGGVTIFRLIFVDSGLSGKKCRWRALRCLRKLRVSKYFMNKKGISLSYVEFFCFTVPIKLVGKLICVSKFFGFEVSHEWGRLNGGEIITFSVEIFNAHSVEKYRRGTLLCFKSCSIWQKIQGYEGV